ncbi:MAG: hypothetical protein ACI4VS_02360 [Candidatus Nanosyncoccaceae bacterium]
MASIGSASKPYGFRADPIDKPWKYNLSFLDKDTPGVVRLFGRQKGAGRTSVYIEKNKLPKISPMLDKYKLFVVKAWGNMDEKQGYLGGSYSKILIAEPGDCCSEMYIEFGPFDTVTEAQNAKKYFYTKFFRAVFYKDKMSQNTARETYSSVPIQDFSEKSDIDWSRSLDEIDQQLFNKYNLSKEERSFIIEKIKPIEDV